MTDQPGHKEGVRRCSKQSPAQNGADVVSLGDEQRATEILAQPILGLWEVVNNLTRLRPTQTRGVSRHHLRLGADRAGPLGLRRGPRSGRGAGAHGLRHHHRRWAGPDAGRQRRGGVGRPAAPGRSVGIRVELPFEQEVNPFVGEVFEHRTFFSRLHHFVLVSDAFVVVPGGIGTVLELMMVWQLLQVRRLHRTPLILIGPMWGELVDWTRRYFLRPEFPLASPSDIDIPRCVDTAQEAIALIRWSHAEWIAQRSGSSAR